MRTLRVLDPDKLEAAELGRVRNAADTLVLCSADDAESGRAAVADVTALAVRLGRSGRWTERHLRRFVTSIYLCAPAAWIPRAIDRTWSTAAPARATSDGTLAVR